ncbi:MAG TPA: glycoside hydrolase family 16 protein [Fibrobacteraceae bacterium]|nr:glycoside hydrolase family 16 protein [Fibrobacteraceae bacterium]
MGLKYFSIITTAALMASFYACSSDVNGAHENEITSSSESTNYYSFEIASSSNVEPLSSFDSVSSSSAMSSSSAEQSSSSSNVPVDPNILWSDEFNGTAIDTSKWTFEIGDHGWGNNEWEYYTDRAENAYVKDGILHIRANKEIFESAKYTSARMITKGKFSFFYGTIEARIALPVGKGIWPAFWMLGDNIDEVSWPACGEIDIIEAINDESVVYGTHHWAHDGTHANYGNSTRDYYGTSYPMDISEFHTYKMTWDKNAIAMYVDDFKYQEIAIAEAGDMDTFHKKFFFILNVAVAGTWPGFEVDDTQFPTEMLVDYIRVYKNTSN